jgi:succinate dehydrogenase/fumarate reductase flavoprotein subunit
MEFMIVDGNASADLREAQAFIAAIRATLDGLDFVEKQLEDNPDALVFCTLQVGNILNAAKRISDKMLDTAKKRDKHRREEHKTNADKYSAEWHAHSNTWHNKSQDNTDAKASAPEEGVASPTMKPGAMPPATTP